MVERQTDLTLSPRLGVAGSDVLTPSEATRVHPSNASFTGSDCGVSVNDAHSPYGCGFFSIGTDKMISFFFFGFFQIFSSFFRRCFEIIFLINNMHIPRVIPSYISLDKMRVFPVSLSLCCGLIGVPCRNESAVRSLYRLSSQSLYRRAKLLFEARYNAHGIDIAAK